MVTEVYANLTNTGYTRLTEPGSYAQHGPGDTAAAQANTNAIHKEERRIYNLDENVNAALKQDHCGSLRDLTLHKNLAVHGVSRRLCQESHGKPDG